MNGTIPATSTNISRAANASLLERSRSRNRATKRDLSIAQEVEDDYKRFSTIYKVSTTRSYPKLDASEVSPIKNS